MSGYTLEDYSPFIQNIDDASFFKDILAGLSDYIVIMDPDWNLRYLNFPVDYFPVQENPIGKPLFESFPDIIDTPFGECFRRVMASRKAETVSDFLPMAGQWLQARVFPLENGHLGVATHINTERMQLELISACQAKAMDLALSRAPINKVLEPLVKAIQQQSGTGALATITLLSEEGDYLYYGAAPDIPPSLKPPQERIPVGEGMGSCGTAAYRGELVISEDIATDPKWEGIRDKHLSYGIKACWSMPVMSVSEGKVIGVFGIYYPDNRAPQENDLFMVRTLIRSASLFIEKDREQRARRVVEERLEAQQRLYETALSNAVDMFYLIDLNYCFLFANEALCKFWSLTPEMLTGLDSRELLGDEALAEGLTLEVDWVVEHGEPLMNEAAFSTPVGERIFEYIYMPVKDKNGNVEAVAGCARDITVRVEQMKAQQQQERRHRIALEASHSFGIWEFTVKTDNITMDGKLGDLFGLSEQEAAEGVTLARITSRLHPDDLEPATINREASMKSGEPFDNEYRVVQDDGSIRWVHFRGQTFFEDGEPSLFTGVGVDVTREHQALQALKEADRKKDEFLATLAHELRNPLAPIRHSLELAKQGEIAPERQAEVCAVIDKHVTQLVRLVDDLMDVSRITRGKILLQKQPVAINHIIQSALEHVVSLMEKKAHRVSTTFTDEETGVNGDPVRMIQIFTNILNNAAKYTPPGGQISVAITHTDQQLTVTITDNGVGIPVDKQQQIFDMFSQVEDVISRTQDGLGIGLTLVKQLTELHDGHVEVKSDGEGTGTTFITTFSRVELSPKDLQQSTDVTASSEEKPSPVSANRRLNVLIVDDNMDGAETLGELLEAFNCEVVVCGSGEQAITAAETFTPDLALFDIGMPGMSGYELCSRLSKNEALKNTWFVAQTGWGQPEHRQQSKAAGFHEHLVKPLSLADITPILDKLRQPA